MISPVGLPVLVPLLTAVGTLLLRRSRGPARTLSLSGALALLGSGVNLLSAVLRDGILVYQVGSWPFPFGITLVADLFSALMIVGAGLVAVCVLVYSLADVGAADEEHGFHPLVHTLLLGTCGVFLTGDLFNLYVWFEVTLLSSFVLLVLGNSRAQLRSGVIYVTLNLLASALFLGAIGLLYGLTGTLNLADVARVLGSGGSSGVPLGIAALLFVAFGIKAAVFPLFFWLPAAYSTPSPTVSALFAGLLTKVGVYGLLRLGSLLFMDALLQYRPWVLWIAGITMVTGVLGALSQDGFRRVLAFHSVSQVGYMVIGLGLLTPLAVAGAIFFMLHHLIVKANLFLVSGAVNRLGGSYELGRLGGLARGHPVLAALFGVSALALAGVPPFSGFFAKFSLVLAGVETGHFWIAGAALAAGLLTMMSMIKLWGQAFWKPEPDGAAVVRGAGRAGGAWTSSLAMGVLALVAVALGAGAQPAFEVATRAAEQLLDPSSYLAAVAGA